MILQTYVWFLRNGSRMRSVYTCAYAYYRYRKNILSLSVFIWALFKSGISLKAKLYEIRRGSKFSLTVVGEKFDQNEAIILYCVFKRFDFFFLENPSDSKNTNTNALHFSLQMSLRSISTRTNISVFPHCCMFCCGLLCWDLTQGI